MTTLDVVRAQTFVADILGVDPKEVSVPVIGGHAGITILPLLSQVREVAAVPVSSVEFAEVRFGKKTGSACLESRPCRWLGGEIGTNENAGTRSDSQRKRLRGKKSDACQAVLFTRFSALQASPKLVLDDEKTKALTERIQNAGTEVVDAKAGAGSATLSMAYAAAEFANACLKALSGDANVVQCAFVASNLTELPFFASPVRIGRNGIEEFLPIGDMSGAEQDNFEGLKAELAQSIQKGVDFVASSS